MCNSLFNTTQTLVIGVGQFYRGDDYAGLYAAKLLRQFNLGPRILQHSGDMTDLISSWIGFSHTIVIDAIYDKSIPPGTFYRWNLNGTVTGKVNSCISNHGISLADTLSLAAKLNQSPERLTLYGIGGSDFELGQPMSQKVSAAVRAVVETIRRELKKAPDQTGAKTI